MASIMNKTTGAWTFYKDYFYHCWLAQIRPGELPEKVVCSRHNLGSINDIQHTGLIP